MKTFNISGNFKLGSQWRQFKREVTADTEENARQHLIKTFGGKHSLPKRFINILQVAEVTDHSIILENKANDNEE